MRFFGVSYLAVITACAVMIWNTSNAIADVPRQSTISVMTQSESTKVAFAAVSVTQSTGTRFDPATFVAMSGEACIFNAPNGVSSGGKIGHVAWAFKVDDDKWVYGSTDGGIPENKMWMKMGSKHDMLQHFYSGAAPVGCYTTYKCKNLSDAHMLLAYNRVVQSASNGYMPYFADCLNESVDIMKIYGLDDMADPLLNPFPDDYYNVNLPVGDGQWQGSTDLASS